MYCLVRPSKASSGLGTFADVHLSASLHGDANFEANFDDRFALLIPRRIATQIFYGRCCPRQSQTNVDVRCVGLVGILYNNHVLPSLSNSKDASDKALPEI